MIHVEFRAVVVPKVMVMVRTKGFYMATTDAMRSQLPTSRFLEVSLLCRNIFVLRFSHCQNSALALANSEIHFPVTEHYCDQPRQGAGALEMRLGMSVRPEFSACSALCLRYFIL